MKIKILYFLFFSSIYTTIYAKAFFFQDIRIYEPKSYIEKGPNDWRNEENIYFDDDSFANTDGNYNFISKSWLCGCTYEISISSFTSLSSNSIQLNYFNINTNGYRMNGDNNGEIPIIGFGIGVSDDENQIDSILGEVEKGSIRDLFDTEWVQYDISEEISSVSLSLSNLDDICSCITVFKDLGGTGDTLYIDYLSLQPGFRVTTLISEIEGGSNKGLEKDDILTIKGSGFWIPSQETSNLFTPPPGLRLKIDEQEMEYIDNSVDEFYSQFKVKSTKKLTFSSAIPKVELSLDSGENWLISNTIQINATSTSSLSSIFIPIFLSISLIGLGGAGTYFLITKEKTLKDPKVASIKDSEKGEKSTALTTTTTTTTKPTKTNNTTTTKPTKTNNTTTTTTTTTTTNRDRKPSKINPSNSNSNNVLKDNNDEKRRRPSSPQKGRGGIRGKGSPTRRPSSPKKMRNKININNNNPSIPTSPISTTPISEFRRLSAETDRTFVTTNEKTAPLL